MRPMNDRNELSLLIDMHCHSSGISRCCRIAAPDVIKAAKEVGLDALCLTNHYQECYLINDDAEAFAASYVAEYTYAQECAKAKGIKFFFGIEVTAKLHDNAHLLIYGIQPDFVLKNPRMFEYPQQKLYQLVDESYGLLVQAHPFRNGGHVLDTHSLHGIEINCHPLYDATHSDEIIEIATNTGLIPTCGGDYHADAYRPICGIHMPDDIQNEHDFAHYLKKTREIRIHIHELRTTEHADYIFDFSNKQSR